MSKKYQIWCITENNWVEEWSPTPLTTCPNNAGHSVGDTVQLTDNLETCYSQIGTGTEESPEYMVTLGMDTENSTNMSLMGGNLGIGKTATEALDVQGNISLTGTVDGRDIATDGTNLDNHISNTNNPHSTTINQLTPTTTKGDILVENGSNVVRLGVGSNGQVLKANSGTSTGLEWAAESGGGDTKDIAVITSEFPSGTNGGTFQSGAWRTRVLNTLNQTGSFVTNLSSNRFTLAAGSYFIQGEAIGHSCNVHQCRLRNITDGTTDLLGLSVDTASTCYGSPFAGVVTIASPKIFELQNRCQTTENTDGFGVAAGFGENEVYARIVITER